jgi:two-component system alkaline phosphatase synthesis response regulator PhoP
MNNNEYKILLVDDEEDILEFLSYNLKKEGYNVFTANNGKEAVIVAKKENPHLIILDVMMPDMDGIETCREIREIPGLKDVMIAFLTARSEDYSQIAGFDVGADDYINKPIKPRVLISRLKALLKRHSNHQPEIDNSTLTGLTINRERYLIYLEGVEIILPRKEFELLSLLST